MSEDLAHNRRDEDAPWSTNGLHGRVSKLEGWQNGVEDHHQRANARTKALEDKTDFHEKEIASLRDIVKELRAINDTLKEMQVAYSGWKSTVGTIKFLGDGLKWVVVTGGALGLLWLFILKGPVL